MIQAVILDMDDTLCLTEAACFDLENEVLRRMGRAPMPREVHIETWGQVLFEAMQRRSPGIDMNAFEKAYHPVLAEYIAAGKLDMIPEANYAALDQLRAMNKLLLVLTSRTHGELQHLLDPNHLLASRIQAFYHKDITQHHKPDPRVFDELLKEHALLPQNCVYVGDSLGDGLASKGAGLKFIASLESGLRQEQDFAELHVDAYVRTFPDVVEVINALERAETTAL